MADQKLTALTATTSLDGTELLYVVEDPGGTPLSRKITTADASTYFGTAGGGGASLGLIVAIGQIGAVMP